MTRISFHTVSDLSELYNLERLIKIVEDFDENSEFNDINNIIELYNIKRYFDNEIYLGSWSKEEKEKYINITSKFKKVISTFWGNVNEENILEILNGIDIEYLEDFWILFTQFKIYKKVSKEYFLEKILSEKVNVYHILLFKPLIKYYDSEIREYLINNNKYTELLLRQYLEKGNSNKYHFPPSLTLADKEQMISSYIDWKYMNLNYLKLIYESQNTSNLVISDKIKLKAKRRYDKECEELYREGTGYKYGCGVEFSRDEEEPVQISFDNGIIHAKYSTKWIRENIDYPTLLNNFIYVFGFTDLMYRIQHVCKVNKISTFMKVIGVHGKNEYCKGMAFNRIQILSSAQMEGYYNELERNNIRLEEVLEWFFKEYLKTEFRVDEFSLNLPSAETTYLEKCRIIASEIDSILKQFKLYVEDGNIDYDLLEISSQHIFMKDIPSLIKDKYIYIHGDEYSKASYYLFSDQSRIKYIKRLDRSYPTFCSLIESEEIKKGDFYDYQLAGVDWLISKRYIFVDKLGVLRNNRRKVSILKDFYENEVLCSNYIKTFNDILEELNKNEMLQYKSTLLSRPEQDYFNYLLNKAEFSNGLDLRNRYIHGTQSRDEKVHKQDYYTFLRILVLIVIKINEEFCLYFKNNKKF